MHYLEPRRCGVRIDRGGVPASNRRAVGDGRYPVTSIAKTYALREPSGNRRNERFEESGAHEQVRDARRAQQILVRAPTTKSAPSALGSRRLVPVD